MTYFWVCAAAGLAIALLVVGLAGWPTGQIMPMAWGGGMTCAGMVFATVTARR